MYKTILAIPDQHIVQKQNLRRFEALGNLILDQQLDYVVNGGDMFDACSFYGITTKRSWSVNDTNYIEYVKDREHGQQASELMFNPLLKRNAKLLSWKKRPLETKRIFCLGNHDIRFTKFVELNPSSFEFCYKVDPIGQNSYWDEIHPFQAPVEIEGILFSHNYVNGTSTASTVETISKLASQSAVGFHSHKGEFKASSTTTGRSLNTLQAGWFSDPEDPLPAWCGTQGGKDWWNGVVILHGVDGKGNFDPEFIRTERLLHEYL
jgi:hypothetical protein